MTVRPLSLETALQLAEWRNLSRNALRTGWTTLAQQERFYQGNFLKDYKYWEFIENVKLDENSKPAVLAAGGFVHIKGSRAEIALIVHPQARGQGFGRQCAEWILQEGFGNLGYKTIYGEVYGCGAVQFWVKIYLKYHAKVKVKRNRKYWEGRYWDGIIFSIDGREYDKARSILPVVRGGIDNRGDKPTSTSTRTRPPVSSTAPVPRVGDNRVGEDED